MDLLLIRHAEAVPLGEEGSTKDTERPLTATGRTQAATLGQTLSRHGIAVEHLVSSPLVRAQQTAEVLNGVWQLPPESLHTHDELAPGGEFRKLAKFIRKLGAATVAIVGHEPDLSELTGWLIGAKKAQITFAKGGVALVRVKGDNELGKGTCKLVWLLTPDWT